MRASSPRDASRAAPTLRTVSQWEAAVRGVRASAPPPPPASARRRSASPAPSGRSPAPLPAAGGYSNAQPLSRYSPSPPQPPPLPPPPPRHPAHLTPPSLRTAGPFSSDTAHHYPSGPPIHRASPNFLFPPAHLASARASPPRRAPSPPRPLTAAALRDDPLAPLQHPSVVRFLATAAAPQRGRPSPTGSRGGATWAGLDPRPYARRALPPRAAFESPQAQGGHLRVLGLELEPSGRVDPTSWGRARLPSKGILKELREPTPNATLPVARGLRHDLAPTALRLESGQKPEVRGAREACLRCSPAHAH
jgi:hypothetical protein